MSELGQARRFGLVTVTSGVPSTSYIIGPSRHFRKVPKEEVAARPRQAFGKDTQVEQAYGGLNT